MARKNKKVGILYFKNADTLERDSEIQRLVEEVEVAGYTIDVLYYYLFSVFFKKDKLEIYYDNKKFDWQQYQFLLSRYNLTRNRIYDNFSVGRFLEDLGLKIFNSPESAFLAKNKRDSMAKLAMKGLSVVPTGINYSKFFLDEQLKRVGDKRIIAKANAGSLGYQVSVFESPISFISFMEFAGDMVEPSNILIQPFVESKAEDYRIIVVGKRVIAAMRRRAQGIEFRSNISKGGIGEKITPSKKMKEMALKAAKILDLDYAGVDIMKDEKGKLYIVEVNCNPQLKIEEITGVNVARAIVKYGIKNS